MRVWQQGWRGFWGWKSYRHRTCTIQTNPQEPTRTTSNSKRQLTKRAENQWTTTKPTIIQGWRRTKIEKKSKKKQKANKIQPDQTRKVETLEKEDLKISNVFSLTKTNPLPLPPPKDKEKDHHSEEGPPNKHPQILIKRLIRWNGTSLSNPFTKTNEKI